MFLGADTGFLIALANKEHGVIEVWESVKRKENELIISTITLNELLVHFYKRGKSQEAKSLIEIAKQIKNIYFVPVTVEIAELSAGYRHGLGIPTVDSLLLATFIINKCKKIYTTDSHFKIVQEQKIIEIAML
ncbi:MAG: type II toxin-antitoxin system VapC family toxin [Nitrospirota bacterium]